MKILYALQACNNGQVNRANELVPLLEKYGKIDILISGSQANIELDHLVKYRRKGLRFELDKRKGVDYLKILQEIKTKRFTEEVRSIPVEQYDLVINDFEPLSAWACRTKNIPCFSLSHQYAVSNRSSPKPIHADPMARLVLKYYAPVDTGFGFHFEAYDSSTFTPVIRTEIRNAYIKNHGHYTVYLPAFPDEKLIRVLSQFKEYEWHIFSKTTQKNYAEKNCWVRPVTNYDFISSFTCCEGILCGAGFETAAEAMFMNKKLLVIPVKGQYEQQCNAIALEKLGVPLLKSLRKNKMRSLSQWLQSKDRIHIPFPDNASEVVLDFLAAAQLHIKPSLVVNSIGSLIETNS